eukprot:scaffold525_cov177-Chaetoceros_neogracile.AAC.1
MVQNGQEVRHHEVDRTLTDRDKATCQQAIGIGHCIGQYRPDKRSPLDITRFEASYAWLVKFACFWIRINGGYD